MSVHCVFIVHFFHAFAFSLHSHLHTIQRSLTAHQIALYIHQPFTLHLLTAYSVFVHLSSGKERAAAMPFFSRQFLPIDVSPYLIILLQEHGHLSHFFMP